MNREVLVRIGRASIMVVALISLLVVSAGCGNNASTATGPNFESGGGGNQNPSPIPSSGSNQIWMQNLAFEPSRLTVMRGATVVWTNTDRVPNDVISGLPGYPDGQFASGIIMPGASYRSTFVKAGTYSYYCSIHGAAMTGEIVVE
jgi:plastocyanin